MCKTLQSPGLSGNSSVVMRQCRGICGETKPITEFEKRDGKYYRHVCRICVNEKRRNNTKRYQTQFEHPEQMFKVCDTCGLEKDFNQFYKLTRKKDGRSDSCMNCLNPPEPDLYIDGQLAKQCSGPCEQIKPITEFYSEKNGKHGVKGKCKICCEEQKRGYNQTEQGKAVSKAYNNRPDVKAKRQEYNQRPEIKASKSAYNKEYKQRPEVRAREVEKQEANRRRGSGKFDDLNLPKLVWNPNERCPWHMNGKPFDVEQARASGIKYIVYVLVVRDGKGMVPDNAKYAGVTNIVTDEWRIYTGKTWNDKFKEYLKGNRNKVERHVIATCSTEIEAADIELDLLAHDDGTGTARWRPGRTDWLNLHPGGQVRRREIYNIKDPSDELVTKFESKLDKSGPVVTESPAYPEIIGTNCWQWTGCLEGIGYGAFQTGGRRVKAHRASLMIYAGHEFVAGEFANHKCNNSKCVNPDHLYVGSAKDNSKDTVKSGRLNFKSGENHSSAIMTWKNAEEMRKDYATGKHTYNDLAEKYGVSVSLTGKILCNKKWVKE